MTAEKIHHSIDNAYSAFESTLIELAKAESARADEIKAELAWLKWRQQHIKANKSPAYLERAAREIKEYVTEVRQSVSH